MELLEKQVQTLAGGKDRERVTDEMVINVNKIFATIHASYPAWYEKYYATHKSERQAKRIWLEGVKLLTDEQVVQGLKRMVMECDFPPRLKEFMELCQRVDGLVDMDLAWCEALIGRYSHPVVKVTAELTGLFELRHANYESMSLKKRFEFYFVKVRDNYSQNKPLKEVTKWNNSNDDSLLIKIEQQAEQRVNERIKQQGIDIKSARQNCLTLLGIKRR